MPVFAFGWPTTEMSPVYLAGSVLDAFRRGLRGDFRGLRGRIALVLTAIAWALLWLIHRRNVASKPHFEEPLREALGDDYLVHLHRGIGMYVLARRRAELDDPADELSTEALLCKAAAELAGARALRPAEARPSWRKNWSSSVRGSERFRITGVSDLNSGLSDSIAVFSEEPRPAKASPKPAVASRTAGRVFRWSKSSP